MSLFKLDDEVAKKNDTNDNFTSDASEYLSLFSSKNSVLAAIARLKPGDDFTYYTKGLNTHEVLVKLLELTGPADVIIANYSLTEFPMRIISQLKEKKVIRKLSMLLDKTVYRTPKLRQFAIEISDDIAFIENHAKIILVKSNHMNMIYISSSNLTKNNRYEIGSIVDNRAKLEFLEQKIMNLIYEHRN